MIHKNSLAITILILIVLQSVCANLDGNPEGNDGSGIRTVDTQGGFNVTDSGGMVNLLGQMLAEPVCFCFHAAGRSKEAAIQETCKLHESTIVLLFTTNQVSLLDLCNADLMYR